MPAPRGKKKTANGGEQIQTPEQLFTKARQQLTELSEKVSALCVTPPMRDERGNIIVDADGNPVRAKVQTDAVSVTRDTIALLEDTFKATIKDATGITPRASSRKPATPIGEAKKDMSKARRDLAKVTGTLASVTKTIEDAELAYKEQVQAAAKSIAKRNAERLAIAEERKRAAEQKIAQLQAS